jgi:hypothetical protein
MIKKKGGEIVINKNVDKHSYTKEAIASRIEDVLQYRKYIDYTPMISKKKVKKAAEAAKKLKKQIVEGEYDEYL